MIKIFFFINYSLFVIINHLSLFSCLSSMFKPYIYIYSELTHLFYFSTFFFISLVVHSYTFLILWYKIVFLFPFTIFKLKKLKQTQFFTNYICLGCFIVFSNDNYNFTFESRVGIVICYCSISLIIFIVFSYISLYYLFYVMLRYFVLCVAVWCVTIVLHCNVLFYYSYYASHQYSK